MENELVAGFQLFYRKIYEYFLQSKLGFPEKKHTCWHVKRPHEQTDIHTRAQISTSKDVQLSIETNQCYPVGTCRYRSPAEYCGHGNVPLRFGGGGRERRYENGNTATIVN